MYWSNWTSDLSFRLQGPFPNVRGYHNDLPPLPVVFCLIRVHTQPASQLCLRLDAVEPCQGCAHMVTAAAKCQAQAAPPGA